MLPVSAKIGKKTAKSSSTGTGKKAGNRGNVADAGRFITLADWRAFPARAGRPPTFDNAPQIPIAYLRQFMAMTVREIQVLLGRPPPPPAEAKVVLFHRLIQHGLVQPGDRAPTPVKKPGPKRANGRPRPIADSGDSGGAGGSTSSDSEPDSHLLKRGKAGIRAKPGKTTNSTRRESRIPQPTRDAGESDSSGRRPGARGGAIIGAAKKRTRKETRHLRAPRLVAEAAEDKTESDNNTAADTTEDSHSATTSARAAPPTRWERPVTPPNRSSTPTSPPGAPARCHRADARNAQAKTGRSPGAEASATWDPRTFGSSGLPTDTEAAAATGNHGRKPGDVLSKLLSDLFSDAEPDAEELQLGSRAGHEEAVVAGNSDPTAAWRVGMTRPVSELLERLPQGPCEIRLIIEGLDTAITHHGRRTLAVALQRYVEEHLRIFELVAAGDTSFVTAGYTRGVLAHAEVARPYPLPLPWDLSRLDY